MNKLFLSCLGAVLLINLTVAAKDYNGAELYSTNVVKYGRFDVRMRTISGSGIVSSFFLYYNNSYLGTPEPWREIDIEVLGKSTNVFQSNIITGNLASKTTSEKLHTFSNLSKDYHTYSLEWTPNYIAWFFDNVEIRRTTGGQATDCQLKEMSYRFNAWISDAASWAGTFDPSILPVYQYINWVKYSTYTPAAGPNGSDFTLSWTDDFNSFNTSRWAKGNWSFDGNLVDFSPDNIVVKDGYCIICLTRNGQTGFSGEVPKDQGAAVIKKSNPEITTQYITRNFLNRTEMFSVSLNGKIGSTNSTGFQQINSTSSGFWLLVKHNGTVTPCFNLVQ